MQNTNRGIMKKKIEILCIMDRSGSMRSIMDETVGAFNGFVEQQKKLPGKAKLTLVAFDDQYKVVMDRVKLNDVAELSVSDVQPRGMTALNDAIGKAFANIDAENVVCLIQTDGYENDSKEYSTHSIKSLIEEKKKLGWDISFIGAGVNAFSIGKDFGLAFDKCVTVNKTKLGMETFRSYASATATSYRNGGLVD